MDLKLLLVVSITVVVLSFTNVCHGEVEDDLVSEVIVQPPADCERKSKKHDHLSMHYTGTLTETGKEFDSNHDDKNPFNFQIGVGRVIKGWDEGLLDMCVGEERKLLVPAHKAYGEAGAGDAIPPNAHLTFHVKLLKIDEGAAPPNIFKQIDADNDQQLTKEEVSAFLKEQSEKHGGPDGAPSDDDHNQLVSQIFQHEDKDKDGAISHEEFSGPKHDEL